MKIKSLTQGVIALSILLVLGGGILAASAATENNKGRGERMGRSDKPVELTATQKAEMESKRAAIEAALVAGDYSSWLTAQKNLDENCPLISKITPENFSKYAEAHKLRSQADSIMKDLGVEGRGLGGFGPGGHRGEGRQK